jgi:hypothetical protein
LPRAVFFVLSFADGDDFTFLRFFLSRVGDDDAAPHLLTLFDPAHDYAVMKRPNVGCHNSGSPFGFANKLVGLRLRITAELI